MSEYDIRTPQEDYDRVRDLMMSNEKPRSSQLFRDKTDDWDINQEHLKGLHDDNFIPDYCPTCKALVKKAKEYEEKRKIHIGEQIERFHDSVIKNIEASTDVGFRSCKECDDVRGIGTIYCNEHRCMWNESGRLGDHSAEHLLGSHEECPNCKRYNAEKVEDFHDSIIKGTKPVETKQTNPKDIIGSDKVPMGLVPPVTTAYLALGHLEGDLKYGRANWREAGVRTMIYVDAAKRHIDKFRDGEWADPQTKVPHLANALACLSIIVDAYHAGKLNDDRPKSIESAKVIDGLAEVVKHLKQLHSNMRPIDYFIDGPRQRI